jgi:hypothetical protein
MMRTAGPTTTLLPADYAWLSREGLELGVIFNLGHGREPVADIDNDLILEWWDFKGAVELGELETGRGDRKADVRTRVSIQQLANFAFNEKRLEKEEWAWSRDFCQRWAEVLGRDLDALVQLAGTKYDPYQSGTPGRRTGMPWIIKEFKKRVQKGEIEDSLAEQARVLCRWFKDNHPDAPHKPKKKTIANRIREKYNAARYKGPK